MTLDPVSLQKVHEAALAASAAAAAAEAATAALTNVVGGIPAPIDVQVFAVDGIWNSPSFGSMVKYFLVGGGGGAASGQVTPTGGLSPGGTGGGGGGMTSGEVPKESFGATETVTVGVGGTGGVFGESTGAGAHFGTNGGNTIFAGFFAGGGKAGTDGDGGLSGLGQFNGGAGATRGYQNGPGVDSVTAFGATGGASGGSVENDNTSYVGGNAANPQSLGTVAGGAIATAGNTGYSPAEDSFLPGGGGSGGGAGTTANGGEGGAGGVPGGGGGGSGGSRNGFTSGAGGAGAHGLVVVITY